MGRIIILGVFALSLVKGMPEDPKNHPRFNGTDQQPIFKQGNYLKCFNFGIFQTFKNRCRESDTR